MKRPFSVGFPKVRELATAAAASGDHPGGVVDQARGLAPLVWMIGKVQSGKSSIVRAITESSEAEIGTGFKACTRTSRVYEFPAESPILRFLDTRGIGEVAYDPMEDLAFAERQAHLLLVTMRAMDVGQDAVFDVVAAARARHPSWPIVVAQTCLHEGYVNGQGHVTPYPFSAAAPDEMGNTAIPADLLRCLKHQRELMMRLPGRAPIVFVPIDLTLPADGMVPADYGLDALADALVRFAPDSMRAALEVLPGVSVDRRLRMSDPVIMGHAMAAAGSDLVPMAGALAVSAIQARLLQRLGQICGVTWDGRTLSEFAAALGSGVAARALMGLGVRQLTKFIPIYGQTVAAATSAAMSFAVTFALGKAAIHFLTHRQRGLTQEDTAAAFQDALREALQLAKLGKLDRGKNRETP